MIPLSDAVRKPLRFPLATTLIIVANALVFLLELSCDDQTVTRWTLIPANVYAGRDLITIFTAMFMHAGWEHIGGNMLFLWVFGPELEDVMSVGRYLSFYLLGGIAATVAQVVADPTSTVPNLGASGAIAAVLGGFVVTFPRDKIKTLLFFGWFVRVTFVPACLLIGLWFLMQILSQASASLSPQTSGVAYLAHIGGFVFGACCVRMFEIPQRLEESRRGEMASELP